MTITLLLLLFARGGLKTQISHPHLALNVKSRTRIEMV